MTLRLLPIVLAATVLSTAAHADFVPVDERDSFVQLVGNRNLTRFGIELIVRPEGTIEGSAFGKQVTGDWRWKDGYFCRDMAWGERDLGFNCQTVERNGRKVRFTSDQGQGRHADLTIR